MPRYIALLRGVTPMNCRMPELEACFVAAGFKDVRTILSSGNVAFSTKVGARHDLTTLEQRAEQAMRASLGRSFSTIVRPAAYLQALVARDPFARFDLSPTAKRVVTFLRDPSARRVDLPIERDGVRVLEQSAGEVFTAYERNPRGPVFMTLLERTFGKDITTRTLATVAKCSVA